MDEKFLKLLMLIPLYIFIIVAIFVAVNTYQTNKKIGDNPCWACGRYQGKLCTQQIPEREYLYDKDKLEAWLIDLAEKNAKEETKTLYDYNRLDDSGFKRIDLLNLTG